MFLEVLGSPKVGQGGPSRTKWGTSLSKRYLMGCKGTKGNVGGFKGFIVDQRELQGGLMDL